MGTTFASHRGTAVSYLERVCDVHTSRGGLLADELLHDGQGARAVRAEDRGPSPVRRGQDASGEDVFEVERSVLSLFRYS